MRRPSGQKPPLRGRRLVVPMLGLVAALVAVSLAVTANRMPAASARIGAVPAGCKGHTSGVVEGARATATYDFSWLCPDTVAYISGTVDDDRCDSQAGGLLIEFWEIQASPAGDGTPSFHPIAKYREESIRDADGCRSRPTRYVFSTNRTGAPDTSMNPQVRNPSVKFCVGAGNCRRI